MSPLSLRPYQQGALEASKRKLDAGVTRQLIALPTGTGKTVLFANLLKHHGIQKKLLVLVHRRELAEQAKEKLGQCNPEIRNRIGLEMGQDEAWRRDHIVIAGVQTIGTQTGAGRLRFFNPSDFGAIVCDEAHHAVASSYRRVFEHFGVYAESNRTLLLGVTATPVRSDGRGLDGVFQEIVYNMPILDAIKQGWLCDLKAYRIKSNVDLDSVRSAPNGDFLEDELGWAVNTPRRNSSIVGNWVELGKPRQTVVFCVTIQHAKDLAEAFKSEGVSAECVWGTDPDRSTKLGKHKRGEITVLTNCGVLTEGYDDWQISCVLLARPTKSELLFTQMIGRGTRKEEGIDNLIFARNQNQSIRKPNCVVLDVVDNSRKHRLVTMATLFGYEVEHDFRGGSVSSVGRNIQFTARTEPRLVPVESTNEMTSLVEEIDLFAPKWSDGLLNRSVLQWFRRGNSFLLPLPGGTKISIEHCGSWRARGTVCGESFNSAPFDSFVDAFVQCEKMFKFLGKDLVDRIRQEDHSASDSITPTQELLLCSVDDRGTKSNLTRDQASYRIARAYEREWNARCISQLPLGEDESELKGDQVSEPETASIRIEGDPGVLPKPWTVNEVSESTLRWYRTDERGYAMPLPDMGEILLHPTGLQWRLSGEISGVKIDEQFHESLEVAFKSATEEMERIGAEVLAAVKAEQSYAFAEPTVLQRSLLTNLLGRIEAQRIDDRAAAQHLIQALYACEYYPGAPTGRSSMTDDFMRQLMDRYRLDHEGIYKTLEGSE